MQRPTDSRLEASRRRPRHGTLEDRTGASTEGRGQVIRRILALTVVVLALGACRALAAPEDGVLVRASDDVAEVQFGEGFGTVTVRVTPHDISIAP